MICKIIYLKTNNTIIKKIITDLDINLGINDNYYVDNNLFESNIKHSKDTIKSYHDKICHLISKTY